MNIIYFIVIIMFEKYFKKSILPNFSIFQAGLAGAPSRAVSAMKNMNIPQQLKDMKLPDIPQAIKELKF